MKFDILVAGCGNVTGLGILEALSGKIRYLVGYDNCTIRSNPGRDCYLLYQAPKASSKEEYTKFVCDLLDQHSFNAIIPSNDHDFRALLDLSDELEKRKVLLNGNSKHARTFLDKLETSKLFQQVGITTPELYDSRKPNSEKFPCIVRKRNVGVGRKFVYVIEDSDEWFNKIEMSWLDDDYVVTQYVEGDEYTIDVACDEHSNILAIVPRKRLVVSGGIAIETITVNDVSIISDTADLIKKLQLTGVNCIQCIKSRIDNKNYFFEINPRPGSGMSLSTHAGANLPMLWYGDEASFQPDTQFTQANIKWGLKMKRFYSGHYYT